MIHYLQFQSGYPTKLEGIGKRKIAFSPRLNILFGPNGSGKSTMLRALAQLAHCGAGGWSSLPRETMGAHSISTDQETRIFDHYKVKWSWDGLPVFYQDCYNDSDTSFLNTGFLEANSFLRSSGEKRIGLINEVVNVFENTFPTFKLSVNERPTLLLDEVDNHIGLAAQSFFWRELVAQLSKKYQLIIATHSIFPVLLRRDNSLRKDEVFIMAENYDKLCMRELGKAIDYYNKVNGFDS
jgi:predicted ATPase